MRNCLALVALLALVAVAPPAWAQLQVKEDKDNVVASRLVGSWEVDEELTTRLGGRGGRFAFTSDASIAGKIPAKFESFLKGKQIYLAGQMKAVDPQAQTKDYPFILIEHKGNPCVVFFIDKDGDAFANPESMNVMLAAAKDPASDLLFVGGDFNNQPFAAHRRTKPKP